MRPSRGDMGQKLFGRMGVAGILPVIDPGRNTADLVVRYIQGEQVAHLLAGRPGGRRRRLQRGGDDLRGQRHAVLLADHVADQQHGVVGKGLREQIEDARVGADGQVVVVVRVPRRHLGADARE